MKQNYTLTSTIISDHKCWECENKLMKIYYLLSLPQLAIVNDARIFYICLYCDLDRKTKHERNNDKISRMIG